MANVPFHSRAAQVAKPGIAAVSKTAGRKAAQVQILPWALHPYTKRTLGEIGARRIASKNAISEPCPPMPGREARPLPFCADTKGR